MRTKNILLNQRSKKLISLSIKLAILLLAFGFILYKLNDSRSLFLFMQYLNNLSKERVYATLLLVFLLMLLNWFLEALKWKYLVRTIEPIGTGKAVASVFCGLTWAVFTPNRIGEYGGRVFFLSPRKRIFGLIAMTIGALGQMVVTNVLGAGAFLWFVQNFVPMDYRLYYSLVFVFLLFCVLLLVFYFNINWLNDLLNRIGLLKRLKKIFNILLGYKKNGLLNVFLFCVARFIVFTIQYCLVINMLLPQLPLFSVMMMLFMLFFVQSALPSIDVFDFGVRGVTAAYFFSFITSQEVAIIAATTCIWFVNLIIPAILGAGFVFKINFFAAVRR